MINKFVFFVVFYVIKYKKRILQMLIYITFTVNTLTLSVLSTNELRNKLKVYKIPNYFEWI